MIILGDIEFITQSWSSENVFSKEKYLLLQSNRDLGSIVTERHNFWSAMVFWVAKNIF